MANAGTEQAHDSQADPHSHGDYEPRLLGVG